MLVFSFKFVRSRDLGAVVARLVLVALLVPMARPRASAQSPQESVRPLQIASPSPAELAQRLFVVMARQRLQGNERLAQLLEKIRSDISETMTEDQQRQAAELFREFANQSGLQSGPDDLRQLVEKINRTFPGQSPFDFQELLHGTSNDPAGIGENLNAGRLDQPASRNEANNPSAVPNPAPSAGGESNLLGGNQPSPSSPSAADLASDSSAGRLSRGRFTENTLPGETMSQRFNRMLMDAAEQSLNRESTRARFGATLDKLFDQLVERTYAADESPFANWRARFQRAWEARKRDGRIADQFREAFNASVPRSQALELSTGQVMGGVLALVLAGSVIWWGVRFRREQLAPRRGPAHIKRRRVVGIRNAHELVAAVDQLLLLRFGNSSRWWSPQIAADRLTALDAQLEPEIRWLIYQYEQSRYGPGMPQLDPADSARAMNILKQCWQPTTVTRVAGRLSGEPA